MPAEFLTKLEVSKEERAKLAGIGATSALMLLLAQRASPQAFERLFGTERAKAIAEVLGTFLTPEERSRLEATPIAPRFSLGAKISEMPKELAKPAYSLEERDRLFDKLQRLRQLAAPSGQQRREMEELKSQLDALLEARR